MSDLLFDVVVVGSGAAGLSAALRAADLGVRVGVLTAGPLLAGSSPRAQGGVAAAVGADDTPALHARDTLLVGAGLNDARAVDVLTRFGTRSVQRLREAGVPFAEDLGLEAGHARRRILHAGGGATGQVLTSALLERAEAHPCITLLDHSPVTSLVLEAGRVVGVEVACATADFPQAASTEPAPRSGDLPHAVAAESAPQPVNLQPASTEPAPRSGDLPDAAAAESAAQHLNLQPASIEPSSQRGDFQGAQPLGPSERPFRARASAMRRITARAVILATGGYAALWSRTTNAPETRGSGLSLAYQAGATLADLEFVQFHPTALDLDDAPALLLSEALRGEGARLIDDDDHDVINPLLPRDVLARALHRELASGRRVYLSLRHLDPDHVFAHFSALAAKLKDASGLDLARDRLPVAPAAHYCMGGIRTDTWGRTDVPGLYAAGETACSGVQGANRLASNSLLECLVFGARTAEAALQDASQQAATGEPARASWDTIPLPSHTTPSSVDSSRRVMAEISETALGATLDRDVGVERSADQLRGLVATLPVPDDAPPVDLQVASLITRAALLRRESRGAHFRTDYPEPDPSWRGRIHWRRGQAPVFEEVFA